MFWNKKTVPQIDKEQLELIEAAKKRIQQKKRLYYHFQFFLFASIILIFANLVLGIGEDFKILGYNWFVIPIIIMLLLLIYNVISVFILKRFMGKSWEEKQLHKLVHLQNEKIESLKHNLPEKHAEKVNIKALENSEKNEIIIIAAAGENNAIGKDNKLIWHLSDDLKRFKSLTKGHHIIMGRKTFESFKNPLPDRTHVVITTQKKYQAPPGVYVVNSLEEAINTAKNDSKIFIIGGGEIFKQAFAIAHKIELTRVHENFKADTFFPEIPNTEWLKVAEEAHKKNAQNDFDFTYYSYLKI